MKERGSDLEGSWVGAGGLSLSVVNIFFCFVLFACSLADLLPDKNHCSRVTIFLRGGEEGGSLCNVKFNLQFALEKTHYNPE